MPLHDLRCECGKVWEAFLPRGEKTQPCPCGKEGSIIFLRAPMVQGDITGYACPVTGRWIEGRRAHQENLARTGSRVLEPGEKESLSLKRAKEEADLENAIGASVEKFFETAPSHKLEQLTNELETTSLVYQSESYNES